MSIELADILLIGKSQFLVTQIKDGNITLKSPTGEVMQETELSLQQNKSVHWSLQSGKATPIICECCDKVTYIVRTSLEKLCPNCSRSSQLPLKFNTGGGGASHTNCWLESYIEPAKECPVCGNPHLKDIKPAPLQHCDKCDANYICFSEELPSLNNTSTLSIGNLISHISHKIKRRHNLIGLLPKQYLPKGNCYLGGIKCTVSQTKPCLSTGLSEHTYVVLPDANAYTLEHPRKVRLSNASLFLPRPGLYPLLQEIYPTGIYVNPQRDSYVVTGYLNDLLLALNKTQEACRLRTSYMQREKFRLCTAQDIRLGDTIRLPGQLKSIVSNVEGEEVRIRYANGTTQYITWEQYWGYQVQDEANITEGVSPGMLLTSNLKPEMQHCVIEVDFEDNSILVSNTSETYRITPQNYDSNYLFYRPHSVYDFLG